MYQSMFLIHGLQNNPKPEPPSKISKIQILGDAKQPSEFWHTVISTFLTIKIQDLGTKYVLIHPPKQKIDTKLIVLHYF